MKNKRQALREAKKIIRQPLKDESWIRIIDYWEKIDKIEKKIFKN